MPGTLAGKTFVSDSIEIAIPANAPEHVKIKLAVQHIYYHHGQEDQIKLSGIHTHQDILLTDTTYYGEITSITPKNSNGDQPVNISGQAMDRATMEPLADVHLSLIIGLNGFDRKFEVLTNAQGQFSYAFSPVANESGIYTVRAVHPDLFDQPVHDQFVINDLSVDPVTINLNIPKNYERTIKINIKTGKETTVNNLKLVWDKDRRLKASFRKEFTLHPEQTQPFSDPNKP
jgi:large repetitive protein